MAKNWWRKGHDEDKSLGVNDKGIYIRGGNGSDGIKSLERGGDPSLGKRKYQKNSMDLVPPSMNDIRHKDSFEALEPTALHHSTTIQEPRSAGLNNSGGGEDNNVKAHINEGSRDSQWSAIVLNMRSPDAIACWFFKKTNFWHMGTEKIEESTGPVIVRSEQQVQFQLPMQGIPVGSYGLVICVSFNDIIIDEIEQWILDIRPSNDEGMLFALDHSSTTVVKKDELIGLSKRSFIRFKIHSAVDHLVETRSQFVTMRLDCKDRVGPRPSFQVHYIELYTNLFRSADTSDRILFGERKPTHVIGVGPDDQPKNPKAIQSFDISDTGKHAVTLYYSGTKAHIEVWDLEETEINHGSTKPIILRQPYAHTTIDIPPSLADGTLQWPVALDINSTGAQVTICTVVGQPYEGFPGIPFQVFQAPSREAVPVALQGPLSRRELDKVETICDGKYFALASYHRCDPTNTNHSDERFWVTDGRSFTVYNTNGKWSELYRIHMQPQLDILAAQTAMRSIQGRYFAWAGTRGAISIWDFETGQLFSHVFIGAQGNSAFPVLSPNGSTIAVTLNNTIQIHDTRTGIKLGVFKKGLGNNRYFEVVFTKDHFMAYNPAKATISKPMKHNMRSLVRLRDMAIVKNIAIHEDFSFNYPQTGGDPVFTFCHGPNLNILKMGPILSPVERNRCGANGKDRACEMEPLHHFIIYSGFEQTLENKGGGRFILSSVVNVVNGQSMIMLHIAIDNGGGDGSIRKQSKRISTQGGYSGRKSMSFPIGPNWTDYTGFFIPATSQLGVVMAGSLILWTLSATKPWMCKLALMWRLQEMYKDLREDDVCIRDITSAESCVHGRYIKLQLTAPLWRRKTFDITELYGKEEHGTLTIPMSNDDTIFTMEEREKDRELRSSPELRATRRHKASRELRAIQEHRVSQGIAGLIDVYMEGNDQCQDAIIQYLKLRIQPSDEDRVSSLISLCKAWKPHLRKPIEQLLGTLLPCNRITWVPINYTTKETNHSVFIQETNPLAIILRTTQTQPSALGAARIIMNYCVEQANRSRNLAFLAPFFSCFREIMKLYPDEAFWYLSRIAFVPVMHRSYLLDNCIVVLPPHIHWKFWKRGPVPLHKLKDQVFQLRVSSKDPDPSNEKFTHPVFMASFDALWHRQHPRTHRGSGNNGSVIRKTNWPEALLHVVLDKTRPRTPIYVKAYNFSIDFYDNPAIAALVTYKWNTIGYWYWFARFFFQCCFYVMVVTASIMQVYSEHPSQLAGLFIAIIITASVFLWLELRQMLTDVKRYANSEYNFLDVLAFSLPLAASIRQLIMIQQQEDGRGDTQILSFSVLAIFLHMLFELRVNKSVCKFVTIIRQAVAEIRVFFVIFAGGILAFAIATLHLLRACAHDGCGSSDTDFKNNFMEALLSVYFFLSGRWDPVSKELDSDNIGFHAMMAIFFFVAVILMLNVLVALINVAFNKGDDGWRLKWIESRLRYIEAAENISYHIPGFRETYDYFPDVIYFSLTPKQVQEINRKLGERNNVLMDVDMTEKWLKGGNEKDNVSESDDEDVAFAGKRKISENSPDHDGNSDGNVEDNANQGDVVEGVLESQVENLKVANYEAQGSKIELRQEEEMGVPAMIEGTLSIQQDNQDRELICRLNGQVENLQKQNSEVKDLHQQVANLQNLQTQVNSEVKDLHQQVADLQKQLSDSVMTQQEQSERQFEELKRLLLQHSAR